MNCIFGPYNISSQSLQIDGEFSFINNQNSKKIAIPGTCHDSPKLPCPDAIVIHRESICPEGTCDIIWYDCPSILGRIYTIFPTPCGVSITSFENGMMAIGSCDASAFGVDTFCFGKIYTSEGEFNNTDPSSVTFDYEGNTFTVSGNLGGCNELYDCQGCYDPDSEAAVFAFASLPEAPGNVSDPITVIETEAVTEQQPSEAPAVEIVPSDSRTFWHNLPSGGMSGQEVDCSSESLISIATGSTSHSNPSIANLSSGHTVIAYEDRQTDGISIIKAAIITSSVGENVRYYRKLSFGTLINNLSDETGVGTFEVFEEMSVGTVNGEKIGFLTGPLAGSLITVDSVTRTTEGARVKHTFTFVLPADVEFSNKNNVYNVNWFLVDSSPTGELPTSGATTTILPLPAHLDSLGNESPVTNPSIAVAENNLMSAGEQNVYITYQAFEESEWRIYLREIVLGSSTIGSKGFDTPPVYLSPYLFDETQREIDLSIENFGVGNVTLMAEFDTCARDPIVKDFFRTSNNTGNQVDTSSGFSSPGISFDNYNNPHIQYCRHFPTDPNLNQPLPSDTGCNDPQVFGDPSSTPVCIANFGICRSTNLAYEMGDPINAWSSLTVREVDNFTPSVSIKMTMGFFDYPEPFFSQASHAIEPEIWFLIYGQNPSTGSGETISWRIQIIPENHEGISSGGPALTGTGGSYEGAVVRLYAERNPNFNAWGDSRINTTREFDDATPATFDTGDIPLREMRIAAGVVSGFYNPRKQWNEWKINTYLHGYRRFFEIYLNNNLVTTLKEEERVSIVSSGLARSSSLSIKNIGFGFATPAIGSKGISVDDFSMSCLSSENTLIYETFFDTYNPVAAGSQATHDNAGDKLWYRTHLIDNDVGGDRLFDSSGGQNGYDGFDFQLFPVNYIGNYVHLQDGTALPLQTNNGIAGISAFHNTTNQLNDDTPLLNLPQSLAYGDHLFPRNLGDSGSSSASIGGRFSSQSSLDNASIVLSVIRDTFPGFDEDNWPQVVFAFNGQGPGNPIASAMTLRIVRFNAKSGMTIGPSLSEGDKVWRIGVYGFDVEKAVTPLMSETYLVIGTDTTLDWLDPTTEGSGSPDGMVYPYFKVDFTTDVIARTFTFEVYIGDNSSGFYNIDYQLLTSITVDIGNDGSFGAAPPRTPQPGIDGSFGFAISTGDIADADFDDMDMRALPLINYASLSKIETAAVTGSCCRATGGPCDSGQTAATCNGDDVFLAGLDCNTNSVECSIYISTGSACRIDGCSENITEAFALQEGFTDWQLSATCSTRTGDPCPASDGKCCPPSGCISNTFDECQRLFGNTEVVAAQDWLQGQDCGEGSTLCPENALGSCCTSSGCTIETAASCAAISGAFTLGNNCGSNECTGACCRSSVCTTEDEINCLTDFGGGVGTFKGYDTLCSPDPCTVPDDVGACCFDNGAPCQSIPEVACTPSGTWFDGDACTDINCPTATGACCDGDGNCTEVSQYTCEDLNGFIYFGDGSTCSNTSCVQPLGACCVGITCFNDYTLSTCTDLGGSFQGAATTCVDDSCSPDLDDPYNPVSTDIIYKPEDLWTINIGDEDYITRVLYHMKELISVPVAGENNVDFMFVIDHSGIKSGFDANVLIRDTVNAFASSLLLKGIDARFGFVVFSRGVTASPSPGNKETCEINSSRAVDSYIFDGLQNSPVCCPGNKHHLEGSVEEGFTRSTSYLKKSLVCWCAESGPNSPWSAVQFAIEDSQFSWRTDAKKFVMLVTNNHDGSSSTPCGSYSNSIRDAQVSLSGNDVTLIPLIDTIAHLDTYEQVSKNSGWDGEIFDIFTSDYSTMFSDIVDAIDVLLKTSFATIVERSKSGSDAALLKKSEIIITYDGDLSDLWTFNKSDFEFVDNHVPFPDTINRSLTNFPFTLASGKIYGIDPVHIQGIASNWVSFGSQGDLNFEQDLLGARATATNLPVLVASNATRPKVFVNNRNQVIVAYESLASGIPQINIKGTGDFHQDSIIGAKGSRVTRFTTPNDFAFNHAVTLPGEGLNQICDFVIDSSDVTHVVWQSNRDSTWEIYYANSSNLFDPVRLTNFDSKSLSPSISIDKNGSIFVVYQDDRFGPFEIMMATKDEDRVKPLLQQDAYLASLWNKYTHYTNILPVFIDNPVEFPVDLGRFWGSKLSTGTSNANENYVYKIDSTTGDVSGSQSVSNTPQDFIAFSSEFLYGVSSTGVFTRIGSVDPDKVVDFSTTKTIGTIPFASDNHATSTILDIDVDEFGRVWVLVGDDLLGGGSAGAEEITPVKQIRLISVSTQDASITSSGTSEDGISTPNNGALAITSDNIFHVAIRSGGDRKLISSGYPIISNSIAQFSFTERTSSMSVNIEAMTADLNDNLFGTDDLNSLYAIDKTNGSVVLQTSLTLSSGEEDALPVGETSGLAYQTLSVAPTTDGGGFFHLRIDFYDNIALEGDVFLSVDSRDNLDAFINEENLEDPYLLTGFGANGLFLDANKIGVVFFDASLFRPQFARLAQPYTFSPNQTYFPKVFVIESSSNIRKSRVSQPNSFSCTKCSKLGNNNFNASLCSYSFVAKNDSFASKFYNFTIDFYADVDRKYLVRRFTATPGHDDLQFLQVNNNEATSIWGELGLEIDTEGAAFIEVHPALDPQAGFLCGINYTVKVNQCSDPDNECGVFEEVVPQSWNAVDVEGEPVQGFGSSSLQSTLGNGPIQGISAITIDGVFMMAYKAIGQKLIFATFDGLWSSTTLVEKDVLYVSLYSVRGTPAITYTAAPDIGGSRELKTLWFVNSAWRNISVLNRTTARLDANDMSIPVGAEVNELPVVSVTDSLSGTGKLTIRDTSNFTFTVDNDVWSQIAATSSGSDLFYVYFTNVTTGSNPGPRVIFAKYEEELTTTTQLASNDIEERSHPTIAMIDGQPAVAWVREGGTGIVYGKFDGAEWNLISELFTVNKRIALTSINNVAHIAYTSNTSSDVGDLKFIKVVDGAFVHGTIATGLRAATGSTAAYDPDVAIVEYDNAPAIVVTADPFKVYFFKRDQQSTVEELSPSFFCECSSNIFSNRLKNLAEISRWESSAQGFSDTRVTESQKDSIRPTIKTRPSGTTIIVWEDSNMSTGCSSPPCIRAATFRDTSQDQLRSSGTKSWFDFDFGTTGQDPQISLDLYDRVTTIFETDKISSNLLPENEISSKICDFKADIPTESSTGTDTTPTTAGCDISNLESNVLTSDPFISSSIVKKVIIKDEFVQYYTYNASGNLTPIVSTCQVALQIHGTPEMVSIRFKNEDETVFGGWCPWSPQIGDFVMEKDHKLSGGSGVKEICIQMMTYSGVTAEFCIPVVADYEMVVFETKFFADTITPAEFIAKNPATGNNFINNRLEPLPLSGGLSVAALAPKKNVEINEITILVEIIPNEERDEELINFDLLQQGANDQLNNKAFRGFDADGRVVYRGSFAIKKEDKVLNIDGLARVSPLFQNSCESNRVISAESTSQPYTQDPFNLMQRPDDVVQDTSIEITDSLSDFRQSISGKVGVTVDIRSAEDPYFVFGDPNYTLRQREGQRIGVPFEPIQSKITEGVAPPIGPCTGKICPEGLVLNINTCECVKPEA